MYKKLLSAAISAGSYVLATVVTAVAVPNGARNGGNGWLGRWGR